MTRPEIHLPFHYASTIRALRTHCRPSQPSFVEGEAGMAKHTPFICTRISSCVPTILVPGTSLWASTTTTTAVRVYNNSMYTSLSSERFNCRIIAATTAVTTAIVVVVVT